MSINVEKAFDNRKKLINLDLDWPREKDWRHKLPISWIKEGMWLQILETQNVK